MSTQNAETPTDPPRRILVVDDSRDNADTLAMLMQMHGYDTQTAYDGEDAVEKAAAYDPHAILLDIGLPRLSGIDACRAIRQKQADRRPLMIALSGWGQDRDREATADAGFDAHLIKPADIDKLVGMLEAHWTSAKK